MLYDWLQDTYLNFSSSPVIFCSNRNPGIRRGFILYFFEGNYHGVTTDNQSQQNKCLNFQQKIVLTRRRNFYPNQISNLQIRKILCSTWLDRNVAPRLPDIKYIFTPKNNLEIFMKGLRIENVGICYHHLEYF
jgi:hypothetical protein